MLRLARWPVVSAFLPGMTGNAWAVKSPPPSGDDPAFDIPITALGEDVDGARFVWLVDEKTGTVARRDVEVSDRRCCRFDNLNRLGKNPRLIRRFAPLWVRFSLGDTRSESSLFLSIRMLTR